MPHMKMEGPQDLIATIPYTLGYKPAEKLTITTIQDNGQIGATLCISAGDPDEANMEAILLAAKSIRDLKHSSCVLVYFTERETTCPHPPYSHHAELFAMMLHMLASMEVRDAFVATSKGWYDLSDDEPALHPIESVENSLVNAEMIMLGMTYKPSEDIIVPPSDLSSMHTAYLVDRWSAKQPAAAPGHRTAEEFTRSHYLDARALMAKLVDRDFGATETEAVQMIGFMQVGHISDRLIADIFTYSNEREDYKSALMLELPTAVAHPRVGEHINVIENLLHWAGDKHRFRLFLHMAVLQWVNGRGFESHAYVEEAKKLKLKRGDAKLASLLQERMAQAGIFAQQNKGPREQS